MKKVTVLVTILLLIGLCGCTYFPNITTIEVVTSPTQIFEYDGSVEESYSEVKKELVRNNLLPFSLEDRLSAILVTELRELYPCEIYNPNLFFKEQPNYYVNSKYQKGSLFFLFTDIGNNSKTKIELYTKTFIALSMKAADVDGTIPETIAPSVHPFLQKQVDIISKIPKISW
jgi:hypothetical protein